MNEQTARQKTDRQLTQDQARDVEKDFITSAGGCDFWGPVKRNTSLTIGLISGERLLSGLRFEVETVVLTPDNWKYVLAYLRLDFILVESFFANTEDDIEFAGCTGRGSATPEVIKAIVAAAKKVGIPTVYWYTELDSQQKRYNEVASLFDHVFCAGLETLELMTSRGIKAHYLPPAIQPLLCNPFLPSPKKTEYSSYRSDVLFDSGEDALYPEKCQSFITKLESCCDLAFLVEENGLVYKTAGEGASGWEKERFSQYRGLIECIKGRRVFVTSAYSGKRPVARLWVYLDVIASRVPIIHLGNLGEIALFQNLFFSSMNELECLVDLSRLFEKRQFRNNRVTRAWREVYSQHIFAKRVQQICQVIGVSSNWVEFPGVTFVSTHCVDDSPPDLKEREEGSYPLDAHIIWRQGKNHSFLQNLIAGKQQTHEEADSLADLSLLLKESSSDFFLFVPADVLVGQYFILDFILYQRAAKGLLLCKPEGFLHSEDGEIYFDRKKCLEHKIYDYGILQAMVGTIALPAFCISREKLKILSKRWKAREFWDGQFLFNEPGWENKGFWTDRNECMRKVKSLPGNFDPYDIEPVTLAVTGNTQYCGGAAHFQQNQSESGKTGLENVNRRPKILFLGPSMFRQGVWQTRAKYILPSLFAPIYQKAEVHMLTDVLPDFAGEAMEQLIEQYGVHHHQLPRRQAGKNNYAHWLSHACKFVKSIDPDVITHVFGATLFGPVAAELKELSGARYVQRVAGDEIASRIAQEVYSEGSRKHRLELRKNIFGCNSADCVITLSSLEKRRLEAMCSDTTRVKVCIRGLDLAQFQPLGESAVKGRIDTFLFVGRRSKEKGFDIVEKAARRIEQEFPGIEFVFAGTFEKSVAGNRRYVGFVESENLPDLYRSVDAVILCSLTEGMPQVVVEAMSMGKPCIVSRHLFENDFVDGEELLFTDIDVESLQEKIIHLHQNPKAGHALGKKAREYAETHFDALKWGEYYADLLLNGVQRDSMP